VEEFPPKGGEILFLRGAEDCPPQTPLMRENTAFSLKLPFLNEWSGGSKVCGRMIFYKLGGTFFLDSQNGVFATV